MNLIAILVAGTLAAQAASDQPGVETVSVELSSFKFVPATITLHHGHRYRLHLVNTSSGGHDFVAKEFFGAAQIAPRDRGGIDIGKGEVDVDGGESTDIMLTAPPVGRYPVHCSHFMHSTFGMKGEIVVD